jgi:hypothetical protein
VICACQPPVSVGLFGPQPVRFLIKNRRISVLLRFVIRTCHSQKGIVVVFVQVEDFFVALQRPYLVSLQVIAGAERYQRCFFLFRDLREFRKNGDRFIQFLSV